MNDRAFARRDLMRAAGATLLVPAFLKSAFADPATLGPRLVILMQACGTHQDAFWPDPRTGTSPILDPLLSKAELRPKTILMKGVGNVTVGLGNEHDRGFNSLWTGVPPVGTPEDCFGGGPSIDQILKRALSPQVAFPTLNCGVLAAYVPQKNGHRRSFSYVGAAAQVPTQVDPYRMYGALFPGPGSQSLAEPPEVRMALRKSVLDYAARDLSNLAGRLGPKERQKLDLHTTAVREYENRLALGVKASAMCPRPAAPAGSLDPTQEDNVAPLTDIMLDLVAVALGCNLTRIVTFQLGLCGNQWRYRWIGIDRDSHQELAHRDAPDGSNPDATQGMIQISNWTAQRVTRFAQQLDAMPEANGTVLDHSLVIWANENSTGLHGMDNLPLVFLGRAGGKLTRSGVIDKGVQTHYQLCTSVLNLMGVDAAGFGDDPASGPLRGLG
jgi:hypothetical protein